MQTPAPERRIRIRRRSHIIQKMADNQITKCGRCGKRHTADMFATNRLGEKYKTCNDCREQQKKYVGRVRTKCGHGRERTRCKDCGGSGLCPHGRRKNQCKDCAPRPTSPEPAPPQAAREPEHAAELIEPIAPIVRAAERDVNGKLITSYLVETYKCSSCAKTRPESDFKIIDGFVSKSCLDCINRRNTCGRKIKVCIMPCGFEHPPSHCKECKNNIMLNTCGVCGALYCSDH
jgi:hypothetical protein